MRLKSTEACAGSEPVIGPAGAVNFDFWLSRSHRCISTYALTIYSSTERTSVPSAYALPSISFPPVRRFVLQPRRRLHRGAFGVLPQHDRALSRPVEDSDTGFLVRFNGQSDGQLQALGLAGNPTSAATHDPGNCARSFDSLSVHEYWNNPRNTKKGILSQPRQARTGRVGGGIVPISWQRPETTVNFAASPAVRQRTCFAGGLRSPANFCWCQYG